MTTPKHFTLFKNKIWDFSIARDPRVGETVENYNTPRENGLKTKSRKHILKLLSFHILVFQSLTHSAS